MNPLSHQTAKPSHYSKSAEHYDAFNESNSRVINQLLARILTEHGVHTVLDLTCGTGSQVLWLAQQGFTVVGADINAKMLAIARQKANKAQLPIRFLQGDMRTLQVGQFDAVITIFNAIGHLTKVDFEQTLCTIYGNLKPRGLYIFDINNLQYLLHDKRITELTIDWLAQVEDTQVRDIQYSTVSAEGVLASYTIHHVQKAGCAPQISRSAQTLQIYNAAELRELLSRNGFTVLRQCNIDGTEFHETESDRIVTIAERR